MAPLPHLSFRKVVVLCFLLFVLASVFSEAHAQTLSNGFFGRRRMLALEEEEDQPIARRKSTFLSSKNKTKLLKPINGSSKNQTKLVKSISDSTKNQTKLVKLASSSGRNKTKHIKPITDSAKETVSIKTQSKKLNPTSKVSNSTKNSSDLAKLSTTKNKTTKPTTSTKEIKTQSDKKLSVNEAKTKFPDKNQSTDKKSKPQKSIPSSWIDQDEEDDLVAEFRDLPSKFQETLLPDLERISTTSKVYLNKANKHITKGFKPLVGNKYAPAIASIVSFAFILIPFILVSLIFNRIKAYFSIQRLVIFIQIYLSVYFSMLCFSSLVTGLEPLRFFYATAQSTYVCVQVLQTLGYVLYLLLLLMYLVLVFSTDTGLGSKILALGQTFVGFAVGLHYYVTVFHRTVLREPPKTSWKFHAIYATLFLLICWLGRAERMKKAYLEDGGEGGKKS